MQVRLWLIAMTMSLGLAGGARADITGKVKLDGKAPESKQIDMSGVKECHALHADPVFDDSVIAGDNGELANVVVAIKTDDPDSLGGEVPKTPAVLDQQGCMYSPHVLAVMTGQELLIKSSDPFLHNVHSLAQNNPTFNFGQPNKDPGLKVEPMKVAEVFKVKCDVHPWMGMWMAVFDHPFFAVSKEDGTFTIPGSPPDGDYTLTVWHEKFGSQEVQVSVKDGKGEAPEISFKPQGAQAEPANKDIRLASLTTDKKSDSACGGCCPESGKTAALAANASK